MKFETLDQFMKAVFINKAKWLREADVKDLATVMAKHPDFAEAVMKAVGQKGRDALKEAELLDYETSLRNLTQIEFEAYKYDNSKKFTLTITCYGKYLSGIENATTEEIVYFVENYHEPLPDLEIKEALLELQVGGIMHDREYHTNNSKLLTMSPKYHREIKVIRLS